MIAFLAAALAAILTALALPATAAEWITETTDSKVCWFDGTEDCNASQADFSAASPACRYFVASFQTDKDDLVTPDTAAAASLYQCKSSTDQLNSPGCHLVSVYPAAGPAVIPAHGFWKPQDGVFFRSSIQAGVGGAAVGDASLSVTCGHSPEITIELLHPSTGTPVTASQNMVVPPNPTRVSLTFFVTSAAAAAIYYAHQQGGLGGNGLCTGGFGLQIVPGEWATVNAEQGAAARACLGTSTAGGSVFRVWETVRVPNL